VIAASLAEFSIKVDRATFPPRLFRSREFVSRHSVI
jgi:hypothetical protein